MNMQTINSKQIYNKQSVGRGHSQKTIAEQYIGYIINIS